MRRVVIVVNLVALLLAVLVANAQSGRDRGKYDDDDDRRTSAKWSDRGEGKLTINNHRVESLNKDARKVDGRAYYPVRPLFRELGGDVRKVGDDVVVRHRNRDFKFRPGSRVWYYDGQERYFPGAPFVYGGQLYVPGRDIFDVLGGRYDYDDRYGYDRYWLGERDTWFGPADLRLYTPRSGARYDSNSFFLNGYATPLRDVRVLVFRQGGGGWRDQLVYDTMLRAGRSGGFDARVPLFGEGLYRVVVQVLNDWGGIEEERVSVVRRV